MRGSISKGLLITLVFALIPLSAYGTNHAGPKTPSCGNYKVSTNEIIVGVKFPKGTYQINAFGISCTKVMGSKGLFAKFLKLKDKDPLPKPWYYLADAVGAPKFSSGPGVGFRAQLITATPKPTPTATPTPTPTATPTPKIESITYSPPSQPSANIQTCEIKEKNKNRENPPTSLLPTGFPRHTIAQKTGTVKWALIPLDFSDLPGEANFRSRIDEQMKLTSEWFETVSEGKFKVEWVVADKWVRLPNPSSEYKIDRSDNLDRVPNGLKLWNDAMTQSDKVFDFTGIQTVNFILPKGQDFITETSQGFPWDAAVKNLVTNEGSVSSFSIPGKFMDYEKKGYWSYFVHEFGHAMALPHIGSSREPNPFLGLDIMSNQDGESRELSGWMRFVAGWLSDERVYCQELSTLKSTDVTLIPISQLDTGIKMVVIPVSETKAVVIESRRENKFSCQMPSKRNGVLVYTYDGTLMHGENFLKPIILEGRASESSSNCMVQPYPNPIHYKGEKISVEGITIEVIESLNYDKIRISKNG